VADSVEYSIAVSRLRRPFLSDRYSFVTVRLRKDRAILNESDFKLLAPAFSRARRTRPFFFTAWVFLPDHWHAICAPTYPLTVSRVMNYVKHSSTILIHRERGESGELWQARFFDRALRTVREYNEKVAYIHLNPVKAGLVQCAQDWKWSSVNEYSGMTPAEQERCCGLTVDRVRLPTESSRRI
jgi:REP-associated tyrosine transposase